MTLSGVFSGIYNGRANLGSACVSHALFGVPPNTLALVPDRLGARWNETPLGAGRETRPTATGTVALLDTLPHRRPEEIWRNLK
jgi:hypothetical protein